MPLLLVMVCVLVLGIPVPLLLVMVCVLVLGTPVPLLLVMVRAASWHVCVCLCVCVCVGGGGVETRCVNGGRGQGEWEEGPE